jgi:GT2 family glycosyltransferase
VDLSVIIVSWNVRDLLRTCLDSLLASPGITWEDHRSPSHPAAPPSVFGEVRRVVAEAIVVDNASGDGSAAMVAAEYSWVRLVASPDNLGFTGGNNLAIPLSRGRYVSLNRTPK